MTIKKFHIYIADLNPRQGTEAGKKRPVVVIQTDLLNNEHPSTIILPVTTNVKKDASILRVHFEPTATGLSKPSDIMIDQIRAIDNNRFKKEVGRLTQAQKDLVIKNVKTLLFE